MMVDTGLVIVGNGANINGSGTDWSNPSNITTEDSNYAISDIDKNTDFSDYLRGTDCDFSIPENSIINGVEVQVRRSSEESSSIRDEFIYLTYDGSIIDGCDNKASGNWSQSIETKTYGGSEDTWGCTLSRNIVNDSSFGVQIMAENYNTYTRSAYVYWIKIKIYYTLKWKPQIIIFNVI